MKAKYISPDYPTVFKDPETIYEVKESPVSEVYWDVFDGGIYLGPWFKDRFEIIEEKNLETQLQEARDLVAALEKQIEEVSPEINVGQKYKHNNGNVYMVCLLENQEFNLICVDGFSVGYSYGSSVDSIKNVFHDNDYFFTLL